MSLITLERVREILFPSFPRLIDDWIKEYYSPLQAAVNYFNNQLISEMGIREERRFFEFVLRMGIMAAEYNNEAGVFDLMYPDYGILDELDNAALYAEYDYPYSFQPYLSI
jgi:hypothetical protein